MRYVKFDVVLNRSCDWMQGPFDVNRTGSSPMRFRLESEHVSTSLMRLGGLDLDRQAGGAIWSPAGSALREIGCQSRRPAIRRAASAVSVRQTG